jgi:hypothetical protein
MDVALFCQEMFSGAALAKYLSRVFFLKRL